MVIFPDWRRPAPSRRGAGRRGAISSASRRRRDATSAGDGLCGADRYRLALSRSATACRWRATCSELRRASSARRFASSASICSSSANSAARLCATGSSGAAGSAVTASAAVATSSLAVAGVSSARAVSFGGVPVGFFNPSCKARTRAARS